MKAVLRTLATIVGIPTLVAAVYFGLIASDVYVSEAKFSVRSAQGSSSISGLGALLASPSLSSSGQDSTVVVEYSRSFDMLDKLIERVDLIGHYSDTDVDRLSRLPRDADRNELVISLNEELVNDLSSRIENDAMQTARSELQIAVDKIRSTAQDINRFQTDNDSISPADESTALFGRISSLEARLSETQAELTELLAYMREDSTDVVFLKNRITALRKQLALEKGRVTGGLDGSLGKLVESYQPLALEQQIAQQQYVAALAAMETARADAQRQKLYLVTFVAPSTPDASTEPRRLSKVLTVMIFSFLAYLIGGLLWSALRDHLGH